jgi:hypothetical protein
MQRTTAAKFFVIAAVAALITGGAVRLYVYTSPPGIAGASTTSGSVTATLTSPPSRAPPPPCGYQDTSGNPHGCWADYLGYIPVGYSIAPHYPNSPYFPCPSGMTSAQCALFQASCGNGVCDPNESCSACPIDCLSGQLTCDPSDYTQRASAPTGSPPICQVSLNNGAG